MEVAGKVVIVTGGASGIGRALSERFARAGAAGVAVADLDGPGAEAVVGSLGGRAFGAACDVADRDQVAALIARAESEFGPVDLFCANAGVGGGEGLDATPEGWDLAFAVNIRAHVLAAQLLVPGWLERGDGYFLSTASAAGLITQVGSAPYAVTKHAAVAFAEWLSVTYGAKGLKVSCLCPMGVATPMLEDGLRGEGIAKVAAETVAAAGEVLAPEDVAEVVVEGLRAERFLILPHPEVLEFFRRKGSDYDRWIGGMRRLQAQVEAGGG